jgi:hypothetical protein
LGWISFCLLVEDVLLASSAIIAIPIVTALASAVGVGGGKKLTTPQWPSAVVVLLALSMLIRIKLGKPAMTKTAEATRQ